MNIQEMLKITVDQEASDIHLIVGTPPMIRTNGILEPIPGTQPLTPEDTKELVSSILTEEQRELLNVNKEVDFSYQYEEAGRFRVNAYYQKGSISAAFRLIPTRIKSIEELQLPDICHELAKLKQGLVLVTGPTGHGKSSTLAAIIEEINTLRAEHIVTIEDPIEFVYSKAKSLVSQREMHGDTHSWTIALRSVLRQDPNVVLIGEMRDFETIAAAITIAETGHLVFATLHTNSASQTIDRIIDVFPDVQQQQIRMQLSSVLQVIFSQRLVQTIDGKRRVATEILMSTPAIQNLIREGKTFQIDNIIQTSSDIGMVSIERSLAEFVKNGVITMDTAKEYALNEDVLERFVTKIG